MAKRSKGPVKRNSSELKTTAIVVLLFLVIALVAVFFKKEEEPKPVVGKTKPVVSAPVAVPVVAPVAKPAVYPKVAPGSAGRIAFVIDDWGQSTRNCRYLKEIPDPLAVAVLPSLRHSADVVACARAGNKTVMLHLPMEPYQNNDPYPTDYIITTAMKPAKVERILNEIFLKMPDIDGVNNHMGSKATENKPLMRLILKRLKQKKLFFIDSMTSPHHSVCAEVAFEVKALFAQRDVFLDNINTREAILIQFDELITKTRRRGTAIAIGHDRTLTMQMIKEQAPRLKKMGFAIVSVKDLVKTQ